MYIEKLKESDLQGKGITVVNFECKKCGVRSNVSVLFEDGRLISGETRYALQKARLEWELCKKCYAMSL